MSVRRDEQAPMAGKKLENKKSRKAHLTLCNKCGGEIFRSTFRHFGEVMISPLVQPFRCTRCGWRQFRLSFSRAKDKNDYRREATDRQ